MPSRARTTALAVFGAATLTVALATVGQHAVATRAPVVVQQEPLPKLEKQKVRVAALPPIAQPGRRAAAPPRKGLISAGFTPAAPGRRVVIQKKAGKAGNAWQDVARARQDKTGFVVWTARKKGTYRVHAAATSTYAAVTSKSAKARTWRATFEDTFSGATLDATKWRDQRILYDQAGQRTCARPDASVRSMSGGMVHLGIGYDPARAGTLCSYETPRASGTTPYILNSQIVTQDHYQFTHGFTAARVRFARPRGQHAGVWLAPSRPGKAADMPVGGIEIDIAEFFGDTKKKTDSIASFIHAHTGETEIRKSGTVFKQTGEMLAKKDTWWSSFHVVSVEWTPRGYVFRVDGKEYWRFTRDVSQAPAYVVLSALTSDYEIPFITSANLRARTSVDWVRVWAR